ncbi:hypothetical protein PHMEG_000550 [Phytophthora megakarya]|uniref:Uncharacterized protein n=1 Tax=Phytophthora megakarya TaxID=4795 RepID=A0A225X3D6_9STRA|nr:hypothetical protein PHMEG_000550 [Phytophthora megakarya]
MTISDSSALYFRLVDLGTGFFRGGAELHMLALLTFLGTYGNDNSGVNICMFLGIASGSINTYLFRASAAVTVLEATTITWPDENERRMISDRMQTKYDFGNCIGIMDGTLFTLASSPPRRGLLQSKGMIRCKWFSDLR